jgi:hypothetical protein
MAVVFAVRSQINDPISFFQLEQTPPDAVGADTYLLTYSFLGERAYTVSHLRKSPDNPPDEGGDGIKFIG